MQQPIQTTAPLRLDRRIRTVDLMALRDLFHGTAGLCNCRNSLRSVDSNGVLAARRPTGGSGPFAHECAQ